MLQQIRNKRLVLFGTGYGSGVITDYLANREIFPTYYVDNDSAKWDLPFYRAIIYNPKVLLTENYNDIVILVVSSYYKEIASQLCAMNLQENVHYINGFDLLLEAAESAAILKTQDAQKNKEALLQKNTVFSGVLQNQRCFIIGNGPSISQQDLLLLKSDIKIVVNFFNHHPQVKEIHPEYWFVADPKFWINPAKTLYPLATDISSMKLRTNLFLPIDAAECVSSLPKEVKSYFYQYDFGIKDIESIDFSQPIPPLGQNVIIPAIMFALYMKCKDIYLLGCDHTWWGFSEEKYMEQSVECEQNRYFYSQHINMGLEAYHEAFTYEYLANTIVEQRKQYQMVKDYAYTIGSCIYNATEGGFLDSFPRIKYTSLF